MLGLLHTSIGLAVCALLYCGCVCSSNGVDDVDLDVECCGVDTGVDTGGDRHFVCSGLFCVATVLALGLWGTLGTLAVTNAQSEVQWIAASCEILSGNLDKKWGHGGRYTADTHTRSTEHEPIGYDVNFDARM